MRPNVYVLVRTKGTTRVITDIFRTLSGAEKEMKQRENHWEDEFYHVETWPLHD